MDQTIKEIKETIVEKKPVPLYNRKINILGQYTEYYGYTVISLLSNDMKFIENFLRNNHIISKYISALPTSSYHMTIYNIWSNGGKLIPHQKKFINNHFPNDVKQLTEQSKMIGQFNPGGCIDELLAHLGNECRQAKLDLNRLQILRAEYNKFNILLIVGVSPQLKEITELRQKLETACERNDKMGWYHVTVGYTFKNIPPDDEEKIIKEVEILNILLKGQTFSLQQPNVHYFTSMEYFHPLILK